MSKNFDGLVLFVCLLPTLVGVLAVPSDAKTAPPLNYPAQLSMDQLYSEWENFCSASPANSFEGFFNNPPFRSMQKRGAYAVAFFIDKLKHGETFNFVPARTLVVMPSISKAGFGFDPVPTPDDPKLTVYRVEEFPDMEIGRQKDDVEKLWLRWWQERSKTTPIWFKDRYRVWRALQKRNESGPAPQDAIALRKAFQHIEFVGIPALPLWVAKLSEDPSEASSITKAISYLTSGEVAANATPAQVNQWWKANKTKWSLL